MEDDDSIWTNIEQEGGLAKLRASDGSVIARFEQNVLGSMGLPFPMVYDRRTNLVHFGRQGQNLGYALDAHTGAPIWEIPCTEVGWPMSAALCRSGPSRTLFRSRRHGRLGFTEC